MREYRPFRVNVRESMSQEGGLIQHTISIPVLKPTLLLVFFNQFILREERRAALPRCAARRGVQAALPNDHASAPSAPAARADPSSHA